MEKLPCNPNIENTDACTIYRKTGRCALNIHHKYFPNKRYKTKLERDFRNDDQNKVLTCEDMHRIEHLRRSPPEKPSREEMLKRLGRIGTGGTDDTTIE